MGQQDPEQSSVGNTGSKSRSQLTESVIAIKEGK